MHNPKLKSAALLMTGAFALIAQGQPAPRSAPAPTAPASDQDEMIVLTPFEVNTTRDVGYIATNTLAGSRLNTSLKDTGAAISVLTPEFLSDLGATSMKDVILFSNNSVPDFGDAAPNFNANPMVGSDEYQLRIRGLTASYARNYFTWETSTDFYNIERLDEARGPNSILFGFGSAGGIINSTTKQAWLNRTFASVEFLTGSWSRYRGSIDANYALIPKTLGLRVNAVAEKGNGWREFESDNSRRVDLATKYQVTRTSAIRAEIEHGRVKDSFSRPWLMIDQTVPWRAAGRPTFNSAQWNSPGTHDFVTQTYTDHIVYVDNTKSLGNWNSLPFSYPIYQNYAQIAITPANLAIIPINSNPMGPSATRDTKYTTYSAFYENQVSDQFSFEVAYNHQVTDFVGFDPNSSAMQTYGFLADATELFGDASSLLPNGAANPNAGKLYTESNWTRRTQHIRADHIRATAAYEFDTGKFGKHRLAGMFERRWHTFYRREDSEVFLGGGTWDENRVFRRHYLTEGNASSIYAASWQTPINMVDPVTGKTLISTWAPNQDIDNSNEKQNTFLGALQSHFFSDHLVTIVGYRVDDLDKDRAPTAMNASFIRYLDRAHTVSTSFNAKTLTAGAVYHVTDHVSLFANTSSSRDLPTANIRLIGGIDPPMPKATGTDFGLKLDLMKGKLYGTVDYYTTKQKDITEYGNVQSYVNTNNRIYSVLQTAGLITAAQATAGTTAGNGYLEDRKADGWEFTLVANPKTNWRIQANFSINNVVKENIMNEVVAWAKTNQTFWLSKAPGTTLLGGGDWDTLANQIMWTNQDIKSYTDFNGRPARGERKYGANIFTRYTLEGGALKGLYFGGGARSQSRNIISSETNGDLIYGRSLLLFDGLLGYSFDPKLAGHKTPIEIQLNVTNLFDSDKYQIYTVAYWDHHIPERIGLQEPRKFTLSAKISF